MKNNVIIIGHSQSDVALEVAKKLAEMKPSAFEEPIPFSMRPDYTYETTYYPKKPSKYIK